MSCHICGKQKMKGRRICYSCRNDRRRELAKGSAKKIWVIGKYLCKNCGTDSSLFKCGTMKTTYILCFDCFEKEQGS
jgi:hypothetical protein